MIDCKQLAALAYLNAPAPIEQILAAETAFGRAFPEDYVALLQCSDGLGVRMERLPVTMLRYQITFCGVAAIMPQNKMYATRSQLPGFVWIGYSGLQEGIFLDCSDQVGYVYICALADIARQRLIPIAACLSAWITAKLYLEDDLPIAVPAIVDLYLLRPPSHGVASLLQLCAAFDLPLDATYLADACMYAPVRLVRMPYVSAVWRCALFNTQVDDCLGMFEVGRTDRPILATT